MSALPLCDGAVKPPCARKLAAAASCSRTGTFECHQKKQATFRLLRASPSFRTNSRQMQWPIKAVVDDSSDQSGDNNTRLFSAVQSFLSKLYVKLKKLRKGLPLKILFFLIGFYCATAFATVIGQTGDWDILSAGLAVAIVECIGALIMKWMNFWDPVIRSTWTSIYLLVFGELLLQIDLGIQFDASVIDLSDCTSLSKGLRPHVALDRSESKQTKRN
ncbi:hypothetical protein GUJ93_ZPchr0003g17949 [Zizania palustris]|uniref:Ycf20-like protein n=1 Tax=Zizania palustris TaxID=103762 RepID=A0A8J5RN39_ZIZPA|nr:hypothetical protein GUJ93_ZPchr0003g17949 [Zizania palustris]